MISLTSPLSCISAAFSFNRVPWFYIWCIFCHQTNHIFLMTSLTMMGLTPGPLVRALFHCVFTILLVLLVPWGLGFCTNRSRFQMWYFCVCRVFINMSRVQRWSNHQKKFALKFLIFPPNFKISFIVIVIIWLFRTHSNRCCSTENMTWRAPIISIRRPSNPGNRSTEHRWELHTLHYHKIMVIYPYPF